MLRDPEQTVGKLIDKQSVAFLGSVDDKGFPNVKAMLPPRRREGLRTFWFTTNTSSLRVAQLRRRPQTCLYFCDRRFFRGVQLLGTAEFVSNSPYEHVFDGIRSVHHQMEEEELTAALAAAGYGLCLREDYPLPNGKGLARLDFRRRPAAV